MKKRASVLSRKDVMLLDDHPVLRYGLMRLINAEPDLRVCCEAGSVPQALAQAKLKEPDVVIADLVLPGRSGLEFIKDMQVLHPRVPILALSMHDESVYAERVLRAGGKGYIMKTEPVDKVLQGLRQVLNGQVFVSKRVSRSILNVFAGRRHGSAHAQLSGLTDREFEVFQAIGQGLSTHEISKRLAISAKTVSTHRIHMKEKLNLPTGTDLVQHAIRWVTTQQLA